MTDEDGFIDSFWEDQAELAYEGDTYEDRYEEEEDEKSVYDNDNFAEAELYL